MTKELPEIELVHNDAKHRYEAHIDATVAGFAAYRIDNNRVVFTHTEVQPRWEGQGLASRLAEFGLDDVVAAGREIVPRCGFIARYVERHPPYAEHVAAG